MRDKIEWSARFGKALFQLANEKGCQEAVYEDVTSLLKVFEENVTLGAALTDARLNPAQKKSIVAYLKEDANKWVQHLLDVLLETKQMALAPLIFTNFIKRYNAQKGITLGIVTSAVPLSAEQKAQIEQGMSKRLGLSKIALREIVDEKIIAGVIVEADNQIIDASVKTQMKRLKQLLRSQGECP